MSPVAHRTPPAVPAAPTVPAAPASRLPVRPLRSGQPVRSPGPLRLRLRLSRLLFGLVPVAALLTGWEATGTAAPGAGLAPTLIAATALAAALACVLVLRPARPLATALPSRPLSGAGSGFTTDGGRPRQCDPDAAGRPRPRAPGH